MKLLNKLLCFNPFIYFKAKVTSTPKDLFKELPKELIQIVFELLSLQDLSRASCVCKSWKAFSSNKFLYTTELIKKKFS